MNNRTNKTYQPPTMSNKMKALHYDGPFKVSVKDIDLPKIQHPDDAIIKVTTTCICGSDLHVSNFATAAVCTLMNTRVDV